MKERPKQVGTDVERKEKKNDLRTLQLEWPRFLESSSVLY